MKSFFTAAVLLATCSFSTAQQQISELGCATITTQQELQKVYDFAKNRPSAQKTTATVDTIPLTIHIVGRDNGSGYYRHDNLFEVLCKLNDHFAPTNFYYALQWPINYIDNTNYYEHDFNGGYSMMLQHNVSNTANVYFVGDPSGACGYFSYGGDAVAIKIACAAPNSTTLTHEMGHYFGLPHTFSGWENGNTPWNPERVTRGTGRNCNTAGDGFCDTEADYLANRWNCPYNLTKYDDNGDLYQPDGTVYMSYSNDGCMTNFTPQQRSMMQNELQTSRTDLLNKQFITYSDLSEPNVVYPTDSLYSNFKKVIWNKVPLAEMYQVKITQKVTGIVKQEALLADTSLDVTFVLGDRNGYVVRITPLSSVNLCRKKSVEKTFGYSTNTTNLSVGGFVAGSSRLNIFPNPVQGNVLNIDFSDMAIGTYNVTLKNINGQIISEYNMANSGNSLGQISTADVPSGLYFIKVQGHGKTWINKVSVIK